MLSWLSWSSVARSLRAELKAVRTVRGPLRGNGGKVRPVHFGARTMRALDRYLRKRRRRLYAHLDALFLAERGALSTDRTRDRVRVRAEQAGLRDRMHPHRFRHMFAHDYLMAGGQERDPKRLAGCPSDVMLERYGVSAADMRAREATPEVTSRGLGITGRPTVPDPNGPAPEPNSPSHRADRHSVGLGDSNGRFRYRGE